MFKAWETLSRMGHPVDCVHCAPTLIENMVEYISENGNNFTPLVSLKILQPGGAALSDSIVKLLTSAGVNVKTTYGSTEIGPPFRTIPHTRDNPNCYTLKNLYPDNPFLKMEEVAKGEYECVVYKGFELAAELWGDGPGDEAFRTNDLFIQDPPGSDFFVLKGRKDDVLVHSNGENTSGASLQLDIQSSSGVINRVLALGHSKPCVSLLVEVHSYYDPESEATLDSVLTAVQKVNPLYPKHSEVLPSMIYILPKGKILPVTPKGNIKRKEAISLYASEIEKLYSNFAPTKSSTFNLALLEFLRQTLAALSSTSLSKIKDHTRFYDLGIDSRLALSLRSAIATHISRPVSLSMIFENPSISELATALLSLEPSSNIPSLDSTLIFNAVLSRLEANLRSWPPRSTTITYAIPSKQTILITGASGFLGTALLEHLSSNLNVEKIYAMVRGPKSLSKLRTSFENKGLDPSILETNKITVLPFSMQDQLLGVDIETYHTLASDVTIVIHNAWKMDFNPTIRDFEHDCLFSMSFHIKHLDNKNNNLN